MRLSNSNSNSNSNRNRSRNSNSNSISKPFVRVVEYEYHFVLLQYNVSPLETKKEVIIYC